MSKSTVWYQDLQRENESNFFEQFNAQRNILQKNDNHDTEEHDST